MYRLSSNFTNFLHWSGPNPGTHNTFMSRCHVSLASHNLGQVLIISLSWRTLIHLESTGQLLYRIFLLRVLSQAHMVWTYLITRDANLVCLISVVSDGLLHSSVIFIANNWTVRKKMFYFSTHFGPLIWASIDALALMVITVIFAKWWFFKKNPSFLLHFK